MKRLMGSLVVVAMVCWAAGAGAQTVTMLGFTGMPSSALGVCVVDTLAFVACDGGSLTAVDVSDPADLIPVGTCAVPGSPRDVVVRDTLAYVACEDWLAVYDVSDPAAPEPLAAFADATGPGFSDNMHDVAVGDELVVALNAHQRLLITGRDEAGQPVHLSDYVIWGPT